ncbi:hypothetical protein [Photobacterium leiognathi]|uniref:hypothetical protein n=1 Tax=Photobacterium leiognathi TaxID=553611 RepID=UPI002981297A|nr:hypothetical protein [Photobacterium leiognathi]
MNYNLNTIAELSKKAIDEEGGFNHILSLAETMQEISFNELISNDNFSELDDIEQRHLLLLNMLIRGTIPPNEQELVYKCFNVVINNNVTLRYLFMYSAFAKNILTIEFAENLSKSVSFNQELPQPVGTLLTMKSLIDFLYKSMDDNDFLTNITPPEYTRIDQAIIYLKSSIYQQSHWNDNSVRGAINRWKEIDQHHSDILSLWAGNIISESNNETTVNTNILFTEPDSHQNRKVNFSIPGIKPDSDEVSRRKNSNSHKRDSGRNIFSGISHSLRSGFKKLKKQRVKKKKKPSKSKPVSEIRESKELFYGDMVETTPSKSKLKIFIYLAILVIQLLFIHAILNQPIEPTTKSIDIKLNKND